MPWVSRLLRGARVWARVRAGGALMADSDGRVDILYKPGGKVYRAAVRNLAVDPNPEAMGDRAANAGETATSTAPEAAVRPHGERHAGGRRDGAPPHATDGKSGVAEVAAGGTHKRRPQRRGGPFIIYADGACTGNPGPCGIGVVLLDGGHRRELSEYLGNGTNNIAELTAIIRALEEAPRDRAVVVHSDSAYALGLLGRGWKAKANQELVARMRALGAEFPELRLVKVAGHAGIVENERADELARDAVTRRK